MKILKSLVQTWMGMIENYTYDRMTHFEILCERCPEKCGLLEKVQCVFWDYVNNWAADVVEKLYETNTD